MFRIFNYKLRFLLNNLSQNIRNFTHSTHFPKIHSNSHEKPIKLTRTPPLHVIQPHYQPEKLNIHVKDSRNFIYFIMTIYGSGLGLAIAFLIQDSENQRNERIEIQNFRKQYLNSFSRLNEFILEYGDDIIDTIKPNQKNEMIQVPRYAAVYQWILNPNLISNPIDVWYHRRTPIDSQKKQALDIDISKDLAIDYWTLIKTHCEQYGCSNNDSTVKNWSEQHRQFVHLMKPLFEVSMIGKDIDRWIFDENQIIVRPSNQTKPYMRFFRLLLNVVIDEEGHIPIDKYKNWFENLYQNFKKKRNEKENNS